MIGNQRWMAENLRTTKYNDGTPISKVTDNTWRTQTSGAYCCYNNDSAKYEIPYGKLYNFCAVKSQERHRNFALQDGMFPPRQTGKN
ncbi:MAG TPA: hypothetical protein DDW27_01435 [Bacteroidales bacterium]|nr:hypothetical protein [Bacteroidales bacterium]